MSGSKKNGASVGAWSTGMRLAAALALVLGLQACGGGGGPAGTPLLGGSDGGGNNGGGNTTPPIKPPETLLPSASLAQQCAPGNGLAPPASRNASLDTEKRWLRSYMDEAYLWREDVPQVNAAAAEYSGSDVALALDRYFDALKSPKLTASGKRRDEFSFTLPSAEWKQLSEAGIAAGYGLEWHMASPTPPRNIRIAYVEPGSAAALAGLRRGDTLLSADGVSADANDDAGINTLNEALFPSVSGAGHQFVLSRTGSGTLSPNLISSATTMTPVPLRQVITTAGGARVGHLVFHDHVVPAEAQLIEAVNYLKGQAIDDLVLDLRYNGGGYLYIASELAYMVAGPARSSGKVFEQLSYSSKRSAENERTPFYTESCLLSGSNCTDVRPLPSLNLRRVFVLTQSGTCSASEAIINGLRGVDVEVIQIGGTTCGKPYGFTAKDNCGISYFPIEFVGVNAKGFGDYADGFTPAGKGGGSSPRELPGCAVGDDLDHALGDPAEGMLAAALTYRVNGQCPAGSGLSKAMATLKTEGQPALTPRRSPARENRILGGR